MFLGCLVNCEVLFLNHITSLLLFLNVILGTHHGYETTHKAEIVHVVWIDGRSWVDLQGIVCTSSIFKQAIHGIKNFVRDQKEPFSNEAKVAVSISRCRQTILSVKIKDRLIG